MSDDKRLLRQLKRSIKQSGNDLGDDSSAFMNERRQNFDDREVDNDDGFENHRRD